MLPDTLPRPSRVLWIAVFAAVTAAAPSAAQPRPCLASSGGDDTARLQAALDRCSGAGFGCGVNLCTGVFRTGILRVRDFRGTLRGAGARATTLRALPELAVNPRPGFFRDDPFDAGAGAWPYLLQFVEGRATIRDLGILVPAPPAPQRPTTGWSLFDDFPTMFELRGGLLVTGRGPVEFQVIRVRVEAEADAQSDLATTAFVGVEFAGLLYDPAVPEPFPVAPLTGTFQLANSEVTGTLSGSPVSELTQATVELTGNVYRSAVAIEAIDVDQSWVTIQSNRWNVSYRGVQVLQNLDGGPVQGGGILLDDNRGTLAPFFAGAGDGIFFQDPIDASPDPGGTLLWAVRNRLGVSGGVGAAESGIHAIGPGTLRLSSNRLSGAVGVGLSVDVTTDCLLSSNNLGELVTGGGPHVRLGAETTRCVAAVNRSDVVEDLGTGNLIIRR